MCKSQEANDRAVIEQEQSDQQRRTVGATLAALGTTHSNPLIRDRAAEELASTLAEAFPNAGNHRKAAAKMSKDMDKPGFTPGPWLIGSNGDLDIGIVARDPGHGWQMVATVVIDEDVAQDEDEHLANARLIAAAPDLYQALKSLLAFDGCYHGGEKMDSIDLAFNRDNLRKAAEAALAKAGGGA